MNASGGAVTLTGVNQVTASTLSVSGLTSSAVNTFVDSLTASITSGTLTVNEANGVAIGPGIVATNIVDLRLAQSATILTGSINAPTVLLPNGQSTMLWQVNTSDSGPGSLRDAITRINASTAPYTSSIVVSTPTTIGLTSALPAITKPLIVQGNNNLTLVGTNAGATASGFTITSTSATRSSISGVTFQHFAAAGVDLNGATNVSVFGITVTGSGIGFRASGNLSGTGVYNSTFTNDVIGATLTNAQNFKVGVNPVGSVTQGNTFTGGTGGAGTRGASTTGILISGTSAGTIVKGNSFASYPTAISLVAATGVTVGGTSPDHNTVLNASVAGVYATGYCTGSSVIKTTFSGVAAAKQYVVSTSRNLVITR